MAIHPTAIVHKGAELDSSVDVGAYCVIGAKVKIGKQTRLLSHVVIDNDTSIGERNVIHPFVSLGGAPQDLKFKGEPAKLIIGDDNVIRESVTMNIGTAHGHMETRVGSGCLFMALSHVAHDCIVGNRVVMANSAAIAGHVTLGDYVIMGGISGVHQFCNVGRHGFVSGGGMVGQDVPPFCIAQGDRAQLVGLNVVGLKRAGWSREKILSVRTAFKRLFLSSDTTRLTALEKVESELAKDCAEVEEMCDFIRAAKRGVCAPRVNGLLDENEEA